MTTTVSNPSPCPISQEALKLKKLQQRINRHQVQLQRQKYLKKSESKSERKSRTRTLIQLGGLLEKSTLPTLLGIELGQDLQLDPEHKQNAYALLGFLKEALDGLEEQNTEQNGPSPFPISDEIKHHWETIGRGLMR